MKPQPGRMQPLIFNPLTLWTDFALKTGEIMLASAHAVERTAKSSESVKGAVNSHRKPKANGKTKRSAKRRTRK
jgi:hypothetical protein